MTKLILRRTVRVEYVPLVSISSERGAYLFRDDGLFVNGECCERDMRASISRASSRTEAEFKRLEEEARRAESGSGAFRPMSADTITETSIAAIGR